MKTTIVLTLVVIVSSLEPLNAYNFCNKSDMPITVIVSQSQAKAEECLYAMGWQGPVPHNPQMLRSGTQFAKPTIFVALHWLITPGTCDGKNQRDVQKDLDDKNLSTLYYMIFESFDKTGSSVLNFLASGSFNIQNTITFTGSAKTGWQAQEQ